MAATALSPQAEQIGRLILRTALARGVSPQRAPELVDAAYSESSLNPAAVNKSSGASGLFQLLSPGYVHEAQRLGGVTSPAANLDAILPDYRSYWQANPGAPAGAAAAAVERSGEDAGFYSNGVGRQIQGSGPASPAPPAPGRLQQPTGARANALASLSAELLGQTAPAAPVAASGSPLERLSAELLGSPIAAAPKTPKPRLAAAASPVAPANVFQRSGPLNLAAVPQQLDTRPGIQVDAAILPSVEDVARQFAVKVNSGYRSPEHNASVGGAPHSDHLTGDAVDFTGSPAALRALYKYAQGRYPYVEPWSQTGGSHDHISFRR